MSIELRTVQKISVKNAEALRKKGIKKGLLVLPTGLGKTLSALADALNCVQTYEKRTGLKGKILVLAHNHNLLHQHAKDFKLLCKDRKIGFLYKSKKETNAEILFANIMTIKQEKYLKSFNKNEFTYIIVDETHHAGAKSYDCIFEYFKPEFLLGITATPHRTDKKDILSLYDNNKILEIGRTEAINKGWLRKIKYVFLYDKWCNYDNVKKTKIKDGYWKYAVNELGRSYNIPERDKAIIKWFKDKAKDRQGIGFCIGVEESKRMAELFTNNGIRSAAVYGVMNQKKRDKIISDYNKGKYQLIFNCDLIGEGLHFPKVDVILKLRPTESYIKHNQQTGRGLMNIEGADMSEFKYKKLLIFDLVGNYKKSHYNYIYQGKNRTKTKYKKTKDIREVIDLPIGCEVEFDEQTIKFFNERLNEELKKKCLNKQFIIDEYLRVKKILNGKIPQITDFKEITSGDIRKFFRSYTHLKEIMEDYSNLSLIAEYKKSDNIVIVSDYEPVVVIPKAPNVASGNYSEYKSASSFDGFKNEEDKNEIRNKILSKIKDGDKVLMLESPSLSGIKEIEGLGVIPEVIVIPNNKEFKKIAKALSEHQTSLNIELVNTSAQQYIADTTKRFDFVWLDYCGGFSTYARDLDILFTKHLSDMRLVLTYNIFDPKKEDKSYYFTRVIDYVLDKISGKSKVRLLNDITYRYKKNMYNIGFNIQEPKLESGKTNCLYCNKSFTRSSNGSTNTKKYCSDQCRKESWIWRMQR